MNGNVYIPKPCHENWNKMTEAEKGRHCAVCSKVVTDFTNMKTNEIVETLANSKVDVCGRINIHQLTPVSQQQKLYFWFKGTFIPKAGYFAFALFGLAALYKKSAYAQALPGGIKVVQVNGGATANSQETEPSKVHVEVVDENNQPIQQASVRIIQHETDLSNTQTDIKGQTTVMVEMEAVGYTFLNIVVHAPGYSSRIIKNLRITKKEQNLRVKLDEEIIMMGKMKNEVLILNVDTPKNHISERRVFEPVMLNKDSMVLVNPFPEHSTPKLKTTTLITLQEAIAANNLVWPSLLEQNPTQHSSLVFPNPTMGEITVETDTDESFNVSIYNEHGVLILQEINQQKRAHMSIIGQPAATYFAIVMINDKAVETHKIILVK